MEHTASRVLQDAGPLFGILNNLFAFFFGCVVSWIILKGFPIPMVVFGYFHLNDCRVEPLIPIYLLVGGSACLLRSFIQKCSGKGGDGEGGREPRRERPSPCLSWINSLIDILLIVWLLLGSVWVYSTTGVWSADSEAPNYCHPVTYYLAFWQITISYVSLGLSLIVFVGMVWLVGFAKRFRPGRYEYSEQGWTHVADFF